MNPSEIKNFYERLGVSQTASESELKQAYRNLAHQWHPDHNHGREAESKIEFIAVSEAYESLSEKIPTERESHGEKGYSFYNDLYKDFLKSLEETSPDLIAALRIFGGANLPIGMEGMFESILRKK
jgi:curved DNA-binding protein CbpA